MTDQKTESRVRARTPKWSTDPTKRACPSCDGNGQIAKLKENVAWPSEMGDALPDFTGAVSRETCPDCKGQGYFPYSSEELQKRKDSTSQTGVELTEADEKAAENDRLRLERQKAETEAAAAATKPQETAPAPPPNQPAVPQQE